MDIIRLTEAPKHHFFGFHDIKATNQKDNNTLSLEVDIINRPPLPNEKAGVGYINEEKQYIRLGETNAYNYPQGARMQWIADTDKFVVNNQVNNAWGANIYDTDNNSLVETLPASIHCLTPDGKTGFTVNYARLFRLGVYGYIGLEDKFKNEIAPPKDGIFIQDIETKEYKLLISTHEIATFKSLLWPDKGFHHYVTHLCLNPAGKRLAFLHRYRINDGGEITRLMTVGIDGKDLKCLATGFLSHFDWLDDTQIIIYGRQGGSINTVRNSRLLSYPLIGSGVRILKKYIRCIFQLTRKGILNTSFLLISENDQNIIPFAKGIIIEDGHPMINPINQDWLSNDTYPDFNGMRTLMLFNAHLNQRIDLGKFKRIFDPVDTILWKQYTQGVDAEILKLFSLDSYSFTRSGLHCDLHPRWNSQGNRIVFDSIHEGTRQMYEINVSDIINK
jgi:hypothetical protein